MDNSLLVDGLIAAVIAAIVSLVIALVNAKREDTIRKEEQQRSDQLRNEDRIHSDTRRQEERDGAERVRQQDRHRRQEESLREDGTVQAEKLLKLLAELNAEYLADSDQGWGTYSYNQILTSRITYQVRLVPDANVRETVKMSMKVLNQTWVLVNTGELLEPGRQAQRQTLTEAMDAVGAYIVDTTQRPDVIKGLVAVLADMDAAYETYYRDRDTSSQGVS